MLRDFNLPPGVSLNDVDPPGVNYDLSHICDNCHCEVEDPEEDLYDTNDGTFCKACMVKLGYWCSQCDGRSMYVECVQVASGEMLCETCAAEQPYPHGTFAAHGTIATLLGLVLISMLAHSVRASDYPIVNQFIAATVMEVAPTFEALEPLDMEPMLEWSFPEISPPIELSAPMKWESFARDNGACEELIAAIRDVGSIGTPDCEAITSTLYKESGFVLTAMGDSGASRGAGQIQSCWDDEYKAAYGHRFNPYDARDTVECIALILNYYHWTADDAYSRKHAHAEYNGYRRGVNPYGRKVEALAESLRSH
jgi:hypothetical protein